MYFFCSRKKGSKCYLRNQQQKRKLVYRVESAPARGGPLWRILNQSDKLTGEGGGGSGEEEDSALKPW
jgi:hypothetical protein